MENFIFCAVQMECCTEYSLKVNTKDISIKFHVETSCYIYSYINTFANFFLVFFYPVDYENVIGR